MGFCVVRSVSFTPEHWNAIQERMRARDQGLSEAVRDFIDEALGNQRPLRHAIRGDLNAITLAAAAAKSDSATAAERNAMLDAIAGKVNSIESAVAKATTS